MVNILQVVTYILDRNACLLPSYLAVNEITKFCPEDKNWPHWVCIICPLDPQIENSVFLFSKTCVLGTQRTVSMYAMRNWQ